MITVVGAGVIGLTCAVALQDAGHDVEVVARDAPTVSEIAGGLWMPYATGADPRVPQWARETYDALIGDGHPVVDYVHLERERPAWLDLLPARAVRAATDAERRGRPGGWVVRTPLVELPRHLRALAGRLDRPVRRADVASPGALGGCVVNAAGLAAGRLAGDETVTPIRGQVVHLRAPAATPCVCDEDELTYVLPRADVCVVGGTHQPGDADTTVRDDETAAILERARALVPALADAPVLGAAAGLRPGRAGGPRVEREGDVVHCYGHGGAGLTLSVGCAREVVRLVGGGAARAPGQSTSAW